MFFLSIQMTHQLILQLYVIKYKLFELRNSAYWELGNTISEHSVLFINDVKNSLSLYIGSNATY